MLEIDLSDDTQRIIDHQELQEAGVDKEPGERLERLVKECRFALVDCGMGGGEGQWWTRATVE